MRGAKFHSTVSGLNWPLQIMDIFIHVFREDNSDTFPENSLTMKYRCFAITLSFLRIDAQGNAFSKACGFCVLCIHSRGKT